MLFAFFISFAVATLLLPLLMRMAPLWGLVDHPGERKVHARVMPRVGGIAMGVATLVCVLAWMLSGLPMRSDVLPTATAILVLMAFGIADDRFDLHFKYKFLGQVAAALIVVVGGDVEINRLIFFAEEPIPSAFSIPFTVFALVGITNAVNMSDGLDGLAGGTVLISLAVLASLEMAINGPNAIVLHLGAIGAVLAFLRYNSHPARVFMGDAGSQVLGFVVGVACIVLTQRSDSSLSTVLPLWVLGFPVIDTVSVMIQRRLAGVSMFAPDKRHIHHRLLALGFGHRQTVLMIYMLQTALAMAGYLGRHQADEVMLSAYVMVCLLISFGFFWLERHRESVPGGFPQESICNLRKKIGVALEERLWFVPMARLIPVLVVGYIYIQAAAWAQSPISKSVGLAAACLLLAATVLHFSEFGRIRVAWIERWLVFLLCGLVVFPPSVSQFPAFSAISNALVAGIGLLIGAWFVYRWKSGDHVSTVGLAFVIVLATFIGVAPDGLFPLGVDRFFILRWIVVWYGVQYAVRYYRSGQRAFSYIAFLGLFSISLKSLI